MAKAADADLLRRGLAQACEAVRLAGNEAPLRAVPIGRPQVEWSRGHLRTIHDQRFGVYERLGELTVLLDARGRLLELADPRHEPHDAAASFGSNEACERVAELCGLPRETNMLRGEVEFDGTYRYIRVWTIPMAYGEQPRIEAFVNATTGGIYRLRHEPVRRERPPKRRAADDAEGAEGAAEEASA